MYSGSVPRINQQRPEAEFSPPFSTAFAKVSNCISTVSVVSDIVNRDRFTFVLIVVFMFEWFDYVKHRITRFQYCR